MTLFSNPALARPAINPLPYRQPGEVTRALVDAALFTGDLLVGRSSGCRDGSLTGDLRQTGLLTYGAMALTTASNIAASSVPAMLHFINPCNFLSYAVNNKCPISDPFYWLDAAVYGEQKWGIPVSNKLTCLLGAALGAARGPLAAWHQARENYFQSHCDARSDSSSSCAFEANFGMVRPVQNMPPADASEDHQISPCRGSAQKIESDPPTVEISLDNGDRLQLLDPRELDSQGEIAADEGELDHLEPMPIETVIELS